MKLYLELAQGARSGASDVARFVDGCVRLSETKLNKFQFIRLGESVDPRLRGQQVQLVKELCLHANRSEEFFLSASKDQWLRTAITGKEALFSSEVQQFLSRVTIQSLVLPWHLYWPKLERVASERVYFPSTVLEDALSEGSSLTDQLRGRKDACTIAEQCTGDAETITSRPFWKIALCDVKAVKGPVGEGGQAVVGRVLWRGGLFARKVYNLKHIFDAELKVVRKVSHPNVVYSFGVCLSPEHHSLLMELLDGDLWLLIERQLRLRGFSKPPFEPLVALDILLQVAKAMAHMHNVHVVHGDLKPKNVLVSHCEIVSGVGQYFVKVADFGSARILSSTRFPPEGFTTKFAAPEVLQAVSEGTAITGDLKKIDVYSFGILAFQILTGLDPYKASVPSLGITAVSGIGELKKGVIAGTLRPPLREACSRRGFLNDPELLTLVDHCWDPQPSKRPHFSEVIKRLEIIHNTLDLLQKQTREARIEENVVDGASQLTSTTRSDAQPLPAANQVNNGAQVHPRSITQDKLKKRSSRMSRLLMRWMCASPSKAI